MKKTKFYNFLGFIFIGFIISFSVNSFANNSKIDEQSIAILPFEIISKEDITYIQSGIRQMLYSRLVWNDHVNLIQKNDILKHIKTIDTKNKNKIIRKIAYLTDSDYVLSGSITSFANAFSIDTTIYDIKNQKYLTFSEESKIIDDVIPKLNIIAARINKKVFNRETIAWEELAKEEQEITQQWQRQNPENLIPTAPNGMERDKTPIWKFWKYL